MATITAQNIIYKSLRMLGVIASGEAPTAAEAQDSLYSLNSLIDSFASNPQYYYYTQDELFSLTAATASYTIGTGGVFNTTRPIRIVGAYITVSGVDTSLGLITEQFYNNISAKTTAGAPTSILYRPSSPLGTIIVYPVPASTTAVHLRTEKTLIAYTSLTDTQTLPPGYQRLLELSLACDLAPEYGSRAAPETVAYLKTSLADLMRTNIQKLPSSKIGTFPASNTPQDVTTVGGMMPVPQGGVQ